MSLGNNNIHQRGEIPEITKLPNDRIRVVRRFEKFTREDVDNSELGSLMGDFGDLDTTGEQISGQGYTNCRLISVEVDPRFDSVSNADNAVLVKTYETLTNEFVQVSDDAVEISESGLRAITRVYRAVSGTAVSGVVGTTALASGEILATIRLEDNTAFAELTEIYSEKGILRLDTSKVGGDQQVRVQALGLTATQVSTELSAVLSSHLLIDESESNYEGFNTSTYVFEVNDFDNEDKNENGFKTVEQTSLSATPFTAGTIGSVGASPYLGLYLTGETIYNDGTIKKRVRRWSQAGVISIEPTDNNFSLAKSYTYRTTGIKASSMSGLTTPSGSDLPDTVTWFEPSVQFPSGFPTFTQVVLLQSIAENQTQVKIDTRNEFHTVTDAGVMNCDGNFAANDTSGAAAIWPYPLLEPVTYRKKAIVEIFLTKSGTFDEVEVAYSEENVQWCSIGFSNFYSSNEGQAASSSGSFRSFPNYLRGEDASIVVATPIGTGIEYDAFAESYAQGTLHDSTDWVTTGIYRVNLEEYTKDVNGNQLYLKTIVTFPVVPAENQNENENP
jgi:hypothetical protein